MAFINKFDEIRKNKIRSVILVAFFIVLIGILGALFGVYIGNTYTGLIFAVVLSIIYSLIMYYSGGNLILNMTGAKPVTKKEHPHLYHTVEGLAIAAGVPTPKAYVIDDSALNAFATGRDPKNSVVVVTTGLLKKLNRQELEGVIAHEMSHIKNYDIRLMMLTTVLVGIVVLLSDFILRSFLWGAHGRRREAGNATAILILIGLILAILTPIVAHLIKLAVSRKREFLADATGALLTRYPEGLASALEKIKGDPDPLVDRANKATAHLFISTPFRREKGYVTNLFSTHPPIDERIKRLRRM